MVRLFAKQLAQLLNIAMPAQPLSQAQKEDAARLLAAWEAFKKATPGASQEKFAAECGWKTQGSFNQYLHGKIPLNLPALLKMSRVLQVDAASISPTLAAQLPTAQPLPPPLAARLATADETTRKLVEIALLEEGDAALQQLSPSIVAMVRMVKTAIAADDQPAP